MRLVRTIHFYLIVTCILSACNMGNYYGKKRISGICSKEVSEFVTASDSVFLASKPNDQFVQIRQDWANADTGEELSRIAGNATHSMGTLKAFEWSNYPREKVLCREQPKRLDPKSTGGEKTVGIILSILGLLLLILFAYIIAISISGASFVSVLSVVFSALGFILGVILLVVGIILIFSD